MSNTSIMARSLTDPLMDMYRLSGPLAKPITYLSTALFLVILVRSIQRPAVQGPLVNPREWLEWGNYRAKKDFVVGAGEMVQRAFVMTGGKPFRVIADTGIVTVLDPKYTDEVKNDDRLSFPAHVHRSFHGRLPGFEGFNQDNDGLDLVKVVTQRHLTVCLNKATQPVSDECTFSLKKYFTDGTEWHTLSARESVLHIVARLSCRIFARTSAEVDERPGQWDAYRFYRMRQVPGKEKLEHVTVRLHLDRSSRLQSWPACLSRAILCFRRGEDPLQQHDVELAEGAEPKARAFGFGLSADPFAKIRVRRRKEELDLSTLAA